MDLTLGLWDKPNIQRDPLLEWSDPFALSVLHLGSPDQLSKEAVLQPAARSISLFLMSQKVI